MKSNGMLCDAAIRGDMGNFLDMNINKTSFIRMRKQKQN